jgi:hypothetical protein
VLGAGNHATSRAHRATRHRIPRRVIAKKPPIHKIFPLSLNLNLSGFSPSTKPFQATTAGGEEIAETTQLMLLTVKSRISKR